MQTIIVGKNEVCKTIGQALTMMENQEEITIKLCEGVYREKININKKIVHLIGSGQEKTKIIWHECAKTIHEDGTPNGTFRSQTISFAGDFLEVRDLTIENDAGLSDFVAQAVTATVYTKQAFFENVRFISYQDTLFLGPVPEKSRSGGDFLGVDKESGKTQTHVYLNNCYIEGDVDFIFGGSNAVISQCHIHCKGVKKSYILVSCTPKGQFGFFFEHCKITSDFPQLFRLARPWRSYGRSIFYECDLGDTILPDGFDKWNENEPTYFMAEYPNVEGRTYASILTEEGAQTIYQKAQEIKKMVCSNL